MALSLSKDYTFAPNTTIASAEVNQDFDEVYNAFSGLEAGTSSMSKLPLDANPTSALHAATKQYVDTYAAWRRPVLTYISATLVDVEANTGTSNQTKIIFPDGEARIVSEDTASATKYRRFDITAAAEFSSGTEDSGIRSGITEATNTWYAIYAVKSTINSANFVLAGDTTLPLLANYSTLNSRYGTSGWAYLGMIRNGDGANTNGDIVKFSQAGNQTTFRNVLAPTGAGTSPGVLLATTASGTTLTWAYAAGTAGAQIPSNISIVNAFAQWDNATTGINRFSDSARNVDYIAYYCVGGSGRTICSSVVSCLEGFQASMAGAADINIGLYGYFDGVLGVGSNPVI